jgi:hypothetical protein
MAAMTNQKQHVMGNYLGSSMKLVVIEGQSAADGDTITVSQMTTIRGAWCHVASDGTQGSVTCSGNVLTIVNGAAKLWSGIVWGI